VFAPVWSVLYLMIAVAGWLVWRSATPARSALLLLWGLQLALNFLWSPLFFGLHRIGLAFVDIVALLVVIVMFMVIAQRAGQARVAWLMAPYAAWVAFATLLNGAYERLNA
jgi:tryptophan-rich sensory protein